MVWLIFFFKQKTAYDMRISDWSSDVCSSDLLLADKRGPGKVVLVGIVLVTLGMGMFTQVDESTSYTYILGSLFVMGLGMGSTMMPIMSSALATLTAPTTAR